MVVPFDSHQLMQPTDIHLINHISPLLSRLHWLKASEHVSYKVAVLAYKCQNSLAPTYLCDELCRPADTESRRRLRSASSTSLDVRHTRLSTVGDRSFPVAATHLWNCPPSHVTAASYLSIFCCHLKSHLFSLSYLRLLTHLYNARTVTRHFGHYNHYV